MDNTAIKELVGRSTVDTLVKSGMKLGLGTGSTAIPAVRRIGELWKQGILKDIKAVATSFQTILECEKWHIPLYTLNSPEIGGSLDLTIDGADEVDPQSLCIKGGGGALLLEKLVAYASETYALVVDESKLVKQLGLSFPVPVEVIPDARVIVVKRLEEFGCDVMLREALRKAGPVITDRGNLLLDIRFHARVNPRALEDEINHITGVVENGFFTKLHPIVFIGHSDGSVERRD